MKSSHAPHRVGQVACLSCDRRHAVTRPSVVCSLMADVRSEERRGGEEWRSRWSADHLKKKGRHTILQGAGISAVCSPDLVHAVLPAATGAPGAGERALAGSPHEELSCAAPSRSSGMPVM